MPDDTAALTEHLVNAAHSTGGWPYYAGKTSRLEPTCWALVTIAALPVASAPAASAIVDRHTSFLEACQRADGLLVEQPDLPPNLAFNGLAALALLHLAPQKTSTVSRLIKALVSTKGARVGGEKDPSYAFQGWPWMADTFSWVEPTAWCLLALKKSRALDRAGGRTDPALDARITEGEQVLLTRSCDDGGWNYGNGHVTGQQDTRPYVPTTALALLAMQDRAGDPIVGHALDYLRGHRGKESSAMALASAAVCLRLFNEPAADIESALFDEARRGAGLGNVHTTAMALYGAVAEQHGAAAFRL